MKSSLKKKGAYCNQVETMSTVCMMLEVTKICLRNVFFIESSVDYVDYSVHLENLKAHNLNFKCFLYRHTFVSQSLKSDKKILADHFFHHGFIMQNENSECLIHLLFSISHHRHAQPHL